MMDLSIEKDASIYIPEDTTASSSESSDEQQSKGDQLSVQRTKMNEFLKSCCVGAIGHVRNDGRSQVFVLRTVTYQKQKI